MPKNDNPHAVRMTNSIKDQISKAEAEKFATLFPLSKSASYEKKFAWVEAVCEYLETNFQDKTIRSLRQSCNCEDGTTKGKKLQSYYTKSKTLEDFAQSFNKKETYASIEIKNDNIIFIYPECYCSCVKRVDKEVSKAWCYCTLGYTKSLFEKGLNSQVSIELLESIKTGSNRCAIEVTARNLKF